MAARHLDLNTALVFAEHNPSSAGVPRQKITTVIVIGEPIELEPARYAPERAVAAHLTFSRRVHVTRRVGGVAPSGDPLDLAGGPIEIDGRSISPKLDADFLTIAYRDGSDGEVLVLDLILTFLRVALRCDANRDGLLDETVVPQGWTWGPAGSGPVLLVNNDRDVMHRGSHRRDRLDSRYGGPLDYQDMAPLAVDCEGPAALSPRHKLILQVSDAAAEKIRVFDLSSPIGAVLIEPGAPRSVLPYHPGRRSLAAEGLQYPDVGFSGLVTVDLLLTEDDEPISTMRVVFRVAPWIMPSNIQRPRRVFMCEMSDKSNKEALQTVEEVAQAEGVEFVRVPPMENRGDRWIQDELEIGYSQGPLKTLGVVLDSPRDRELDSYPERLIAPDFGWVTRGDDGMPANSLDSFGNLEVSPPVVVDGRPYPLGRIIFGGAHPTGQGRRMAKTVSDFLYAQAVQPPVELYSDWLRVGHVDEFMSFVPAADDRRFRLLLASPALAWRLLSEAADSGHDLLAWLVGKDRAGVRADVTVAEALADTGLREANLQYQRFIDWNRTILKRELGLTESHIIDLPVLYTPERGGAGAYFPDVVNLLVVNQTVVVPKPFGPEVDGFCIFERAIRERLEPLGLHCVFVDTWYSYHVDAGEIHCGTNAYREPMQVQWWTVNPASGVVA